MAEETLHETARWMISLHDPRGNLQDPTKCLACRNPHPCPTRRLAEAYLERAEKGHWVCRHCTDTQEAHKDAAATHLYEPTWEAL